MSDEDALLEAIATHPTEDTPRLVFADWLDEHGRHDRAEFIRVQVAIGQIEMLPRIELNRHVELFRRNQELIDDRRAELLGPLTALPSNAAVQFHRGFVEEVTISVFHFHQLRDVLATMRPLPCVTVRDSVGSIRDFLGFHYLLPPEEKPEHAQELVTAIRTAPGKDDDEDQRWILERDLCEATGSQWLRLSELDLAGCRLGDSSVSSLLNRSRFPALTDLDISSNDLTDLVLDALLDFGLSKQLRRLILGGNLITDDGAAELANSWPSGADDHLEHLNLRFTDIGTAGQSALLRRFGGRVDLF